MADKNAPKFDDVEVVVTKRIFYKNSLREPGFKFKFTGEKLLNGTALAADAPAPAKAKPLNGDTKPKDTQAAVQQKAAAAANGGSLA